MDIVFSNKISSLKPSAIRDILTNSADPSVIPFAAGNPSPDAFPVEDVREISQNIFSCQASAALQYSITEGYAPLREFMAGYVNKRYGIGKDFDNLIITSGAQQVMDLAAKVLCNEGDTVICETPSFIGSLNCFRSHGLRLAGIPVQNDGMDMDKLEEALKNNNNVKFIYTIPNFQNPSGVTMSLSKRKRLYELAKKYNTLIVEDNPYGDLRVEGEDIPSIKTMDEDGLVIYAGSFSKILSPGLRVGYSVAPEAITAKMTVGKQTADVHTTIFSQMLVYEWMREYDPERHIEKIKQIYKRKLDLMCSYLDSGSLKKFFSYQKPQGGLFIWCGMPENVDVLSFCGDIIRHKVAVVPGSAFLADESETPHHVRINFSTPTDDQIIKGMEILDRIAEQLKVENGK